MSNELIKWLNSYSPIPVGKLLFEYGSENSGYSNLTELIFNIADSVEMSYVTVRTSDLIDVDHEEMPKNYLCYNANKEIIDSDTVTFCKTFKEAKRYDYIVIMDPQKRISLKSKHLFYLLTRYSHDIIITSGFLISIFYQFSFITLLILMQGIAIYLLHGLAFQKNTKVISSICRVGGEKDSCLELQKESGLIFKYFQFSEAGLIYFYALFFWSIAYSISPLFASNNFLIFHYGLLFIFTYSIVKQRQKNIYCPVCLVIDLFIVIQFLAIFFSFRMNYIFNYSMGDVLLLLLSLFCSLLIVTLRKLLMHYQREAYKNDYTIKELIISNSRSIASNFNLVDKDVVELFKLAFYNKTESPSEKILFCLNINCPSCISTAYNMRYLVNSKFKLTMAFQIDNIHKYDMESPTIKYCIYLSIIFEEIGIPEFSRAIVAFSLHRNKLEFLKKVLKTHKLNIDNLRLTEAWKTLLLQNEIFAKQSIVEFPYIIQKNKVISPFISPKYYEVIL